MDNETRSALNSLLEAADTMILEADCCAHDCPCVQRLRTTVQNMRKILGGDQPTTDTP